MIITGFGLERKWVNQKEEMNGLSVLVVAVTIVEVHLNNNTRKTVD